MKRLKIQWFTMLFSILLATASCEEKSQNVQYSDGIMPTSTNYQPSTIIDSLAKIFLDSSKCQDCINEVYIDKVSFIESYITFRATTYDQKYQTDYLRKQNPLFYFIKQNQKIFIITGIEDYVAGNQSISKNISYSAKATKAEFELIVKYKILEDSIIMQKVAGLPFMPEMNQDVPSGDSIPLFDPKKDYSQ